jgi:transcription termination factor NusB
MSRPIIKSGLCGVLATVAVLSYTHVGSHEEIDMEMKQSISEECNFVPDEYNYNQYYKIMAEDDKIKEQIEIIHNVVSILLENGEELDPNFSQTVSKHFWNLA